MKKCNEQYTTDQILPSGKTNLKSSPVNRNVFSRDEMNLAEFPLTVLFSRADPKVKTLEFSDTIKGKNGELINRKWIITGADKFGLPTSSDDEVLLGLLKLTVDDGIKQRKINFTRYELLKVLQWPPEGRNYSRLQKALDRLSGVRIKASNAFFDNEAKLHSTKNFGIVDAYELNDGRGDEDKSSYFIWSEILFKSFQVGFIKKLDWNFYLEMDSSVSKRLYRYLDKHFWYKSQLKINIFILAHEKLGISRNYKYVSSVRQHLDQASQELIDKGFIENYEVVGKGSQTEVIDTVKKNSQINNLPPFYEKKNTYLNFSEKDGVPKTKNNYVDNNLNSEGGLSAAEKQFSSIKSKLIERGLKAEQVDRLLILRNIATLNKVAELINYYDKLVSTNSRLVSISPVGFLYRAIERIDTFILPGRTQNIESVSNEQVTFSVGKISKKVITKKTLNNEWQENQRYLDYKNKEIDRLINTLDQNIINNYRSQVKKNLLRISDAISPDRLKISIEHGVREMIAKNHGVINSLKGYKQLFENQ